MQVNHIFPLCWKIKSHKMRKTKMLTQCINNKIEMIPQGNSIMVKHEKS